MKRKKIIALTSILTFSLNVFAPTIFAQELVTDSNIINSENSVNTNDSENKTNQENQESETEIKDDKNNKVDNSINNNIEKDNTKNNSVENETNDAKKEEIHPHSTKEVNAKIASRKQIYETRFLDNNNNANIQYAYVDYNLSNGEASNGIIANLIFDGKDGVYTEDNNFFVKYNVYSRLDGMVKDYAEVTRPNYGREIEVHRTTYDKVNTGRVDVSNPQAYLPLRRGDVFFQESNRCYVNMNSEVFKYREPVLSEKKQIRILANGDLRLENFLERNNSSIDFDCSTLEFGNLRIKFRGDNNMPFLDIDPNITAENNLQIKIQNRIFACNEGQNLYEAFEELQGLYIEEYDKMQVTINGKTTNFSYDGTSNTFKRLAEIPDENLLAALNEVVSKMQGNVRPKDAPIWVDELKKITEPLKFIGKNISDLTGIENCTSIQMLDLKGNNISNIEPLRNLNNLRILSLGDDITSQAGNNISNIEPLSGLRDLRKLSLSCNNISDIKPLANLTSLSYLELSRNNITDISALKDLTNLTELYLNNNNISNIEPLTNLRYLEKLFLNFNNISDLQPLSGLIRLKNLDLRNNSISNLQPLSDLNRIISINLSNQSIRSSEVKSEGKEAVVDNIVKDLNGSFVEIAPGDGYTYDNITHKVKFTKIAQTGDQSYPFTKQVRIGQANATFSGTVTQNIVYDRIVEIHDKNFKACLNRNLYNTAVDDQYDNNDITLSQLEGLTRIEKFNVKGIKDISGIEYCKNITFIDFNNENISNIEALKGLTKLQTLKLSSNNISNIEALGGLTNLTYLSLDGNQITNISALSGLINLTELYLGYSNNGNQISDINPLKTLTSLTKLDLACNNVSDLKPLSSLTKLTYLGLGKNNISNIQPLQGLTKLTELWLQDQKVNGIDVNSVGTIAEVDNIVKDLNGSFVEIASGDGYTYDNITHKVKFTKIAQTGDQSYPFTKQVRIGQANATFSGTVTQNIVYNELADIPDENLKAALNKAIASQTSTERTDIQEITVTELKALTGTLDFSNRGISNLRGIEYCTSISKLNLINNNVSTLQPLSGLTKLNDLRLAHNEITNIEPLSELTNLTYLSLDDNLITNINALSRLTNLQTLYLGYSFDNSGNQISDINPLKTLTSLISLDLSNNEVSDISALKGLSKLQTIYAVGNQIENIELVTRLPNLTRVDLRRNKISDISPLELLKDTNANINVQEQNIRLENVTVDDGSVEITNPVSYPEFYKENPYVNISPSGDISYVKEGNKLKLSSLSDSITEFTIDENTSINNGKINISYSVNITLPVEHVSTIKVDLPTSMTFNVVTNTVDSEPTFATADYTIKNRGKKPVNITPSYTVTKQGGVDLVESISDRDIAKDDNVKIAVKLKNITRNEDVMSVVNNTIGTQFSVGAESNIQLRLEPSTNGMADAKKEQLSNTKNTSGKMTFTISN